MQSTIQLKAEHVSSRIQQESFVACRKGDFEISIEINLSAILSW